MTLEVSYTQDLLLNDSNHYHGTPKCRLSVGFRRNDLLALTFSKGGRQSHGNPSPKRVIYMVLQLGLSDLSP